MKTHNPHLNILLKKAPILFLIFVLVLLPIGPAKSAIAALTSPTLDEASIDVQVLYSGKGPAPVKVIAPAKASVGEEITLTVMSVAVQDLAGFQFRFDYNEQGLAYTGAQLNQASWAAGTSPLKMGPVHLDGSVLFGSATCPVGDCSSTDYFSTQKSHGAINGNAALAEVRFVVRQPGVQQLTLTDVRMVDFQGGSLVDGRQAPMLAKGQTDLSSNSVTNDSDAFDVMAAWAESVERGASLVPSQATYDLDGSGYLDVADVQAVLSRWGELTLPAGTSSLPQPGSESANAPALVTFTVNSSLDDGDAIVGDQQCKTANGDCTLRAAIEQANWSPDDVLINFNVRGPGDTCPTLVTIQTDPAKSTIKVDNGFGKAITIDGYTQCEASPNTGKIKGNAKIKIELKGNSIPGVRGIQVNSPFVTIKGLAVFGFDHQIYYTGPRASNGIIQGNFAGTNVQQNYFTRLPNYIDPGTGKVVSVESEGIRMNYGANNNLIGGQNAADRNLVSANDSDGLTFQGDGVDNNKAFNNYIGLKQDGMTPLPNSADGVDVAENAANTQIGGLNPGDRNVIAGNSRDGIEISHGQGLDKPTLILGNFVGLSADGTTVIGNGQKGVTLEDLPTVTIMRQNIVVGSKAVGVRIYTSNGNQVMDNFIGAYPPGIGPDQVIPLPGTVNLDTLVVAPNGTDASVNQGISGVYLTGGSKHNTVSRNVIANHPEYGIYIDVDPGYLAIGTCDPYFNTFSRNFIFNNISNGIRLKSGTDCKGTPGTYAANQGIEVPTLDQASASTTQVTGTSVNCANCKVEIFLADKGQHPDPGGDSNGEGKIFLADGMTDAAGNFDIHYQPVGLGMILTATITDPAGNTSQFARNVMVIKEGPPPPTPVTPSPTTPVPTVPITPVPPTVTPTPPPGTPSLWLPLIVN